MCCVYDFGFIYAIRKTIKKIITLRLRKGEDDHDIAIKYEDRIIKEDLESSTEKLRQLGTVNFVGK